MSKTNILLNIQKHIQLNDDEKARINASFCDANFGKNEVIIEQSRLCKKLFYVEEGSLRAFNVNQHGKESTIMFAIKDWWITDMYSFTNKTQLFYRVHAIFGSSILGKPDIDQLVSVSIGQYISQ